MRRHGPALIVACVLSLALGACKSDWKPPPPRDRSGETAPGDATDGGEVVEARATRTTPPDVWPRMRWFALPIDATNADPMEPVTRLTVHHTGEPQHWSGQDLDEAGWRMGVYQKAHMERRGWADIAYHYVIDPAGRIWEGRRIRWQGAHAGDRETNRANVGVCLMGNFEIGEPTEAQRESLAELVWWFVREYGISADEIHTHKGIKAKYGLPGTACPGRNLEPYVDRLREDVAASLAAPD